MQSIASTAVHSAAQALNSSQPQPRLVRAAHEFEAQMMKELLKPMTGNSALTGEEDGADGNSGSNGAMGEYASEALGQALSQHGGFGMADRIIHDLSHSGTSANPSKVTGKLHINTVISASQSLK